MARRTAPGALAAAAPQRDVSRHVQPLPLPALWPASPRASASGLDRLRPSVRDRLTKILWRSRGEGGGVTWKSPLLSDSGGPYSTNGRDPAVFSAEVEANVERLMADADMQAALPRLAGRGPRAAATHLQTSTWLWAARSSRCPQDLLAVQGAHLAGGVPEPRDRDRHRPWRLTRPLRLGARSCWAAIGSSSAWTSTSRAHNRRAIERHSAGPTGSG